MTAAPAVEDLPAADPVEAGYAFPPRVIRDETGYGRPPRSGRFQPGRSGNPLGRPRRPRPPEGAPPAARTELERAMARQIDCDIGGYVRRVPIIRMVVARLADRAMAGDVTACRELARLWSEAEALRAAREAEAARRAAEDAALAEAAARERVQAARFELEALARVGACRDGDFDAEDHARALKALDAATLDDEGELATVEPWVVEAAVAHDPDTPDDVTLDADDPDEVRHSLCRLRILARDGRGEHGLAAWFVDAARARLGRALDRGDEALLQLVRVDPAAPADWPARLRTVLGDAWAGGVAAH